jgi:hypothetical protein
LRGEARRGAGVGGVLVLGQEDELLARALGRDDTPLEEELAQARLVSRVKRRLARVCKRLFGAGVLVVGPRRGEIPIGLDEIFELLLRVRFWGVDVVVF